MQSLLTRITSKLSARFKLLRDRRGAVAAYVAIVITPIVMAAGLGVDGSRSYLVKARLSQALDAAALAGGRVVFSSTRDDDINMFFNANFPSGYMDASLGALYINVTEDGSVITLRRTATIPTTFMRVAGYDDITIAAETVVRRSNRSMELVLVMDNTGSMHGSKIGAMKDAAIDLVNILYGDRETMPNFWMGLVPYAAFVNIGNSRTSWLQSGSLNQALYSPSVWKGCVEARPNPYEEDQAEALPSTRGWVPSRWASTAGVTWTHNGNTIQGDNNWPPVNETSAHLEGYRNNMTGPNIGCPPEIMGLQQSKSAAIAAINAMGPWFRGGTMANLGLAWGWRMLSPTWRGMWGGSTPANLPLDYNTPYMDKVVVLLTDGVNEWYDWNGKDNNPQNGGDSPRRGGPGKYTNGTLPQSDADYTAYGRLSEQRLGTSNNGTATGIVNTRMGNLCTAMKARGITIYTIVLQVNNETTQNLFRNCATRPEYYFNSPSSSDLAVIFRTIGQQLSNLRIAQ